MGAEEGRNDLEIKNVHTGVRPAGPLGRGGAEGRAGSSSGFRGDTGDSARGEAAVPRSEGNQTTAEGAPDEGREIDGEL